MASDASIALIIAAIVGGIVVSILGGSHVLPLNLGNGLVLVLLVAIAFRLRESTSALCARGTIITFRLFFRDGDSSRLFFHPAIQGMLAAIGLIYFRQTIFIMLAHKINRRHHRLPWWKCNFYRDACIMK
jgi:hypothetical protein